MPADDIRPTANPVTAYFKEARPNPAFLEKLDAVRELLTAGGRSLTQGAICWLWAKGDGNMPIPGARTVAQIEGIAGALAYGAFTAEEMARIEAQIIPEPEQLPEQAR